MLDEHVFKTICEITDHCLVSNRVLDGETHVSIAELNTSEKCSRSLGDAQLHSRKV